MKQPKVGETVFVYQLDGERVGDIEFCTSTQSNACKTIEQIKQEIMDNAENSDHPELYNAAIIYKLIRVE